MERLSLEDDHVQTTVMPAQVNGGQLPSHVLPFCAAAAVLAALLPIAAFFLTRAEACLRERPAVANAPQVHDAAMSCRHSQHAFPVEDRGLHRALAVLWLNAQHF